MLELRTYRVNESSSDRIVFIDSESCLFNVYLIFLYVLIERFSPVC